MMRYQQSLEIERRLAAVLRLIRAGRYSTPAIASRIGVSIPTVSRCVQALRERGHEIKAEWHERAWRYVLVTPTGSHREDSARLHASQDTQASRA